MKIKATTTALLTIALLQACSDGSDGPKAAPSSLTVVPTAAPEGAPGR